MECPQCGAENTNDAEFCSMCLEPFNATPSPAMIVRSIGPIGSTQPRRLWEAIDADRFTAPRTVLLAVAALLLVGTLVAETLDGVPFWAWSTLQLMLVCVMTVLGVGWFLTIRRNSLWLASVPDSDGAVIPRTIDALSSIAAASERIPELRYFASDAVNAYVATEAGRTRVCVTLKFAALPLEEQEAGLALLLGRVRTDGNAREMSQLGYLVRGHAQDVLRSWLAVAEEADREGLLILKDPQPIIRLLTRLAKSRTIVAGVSLVDPSVFGFLAWPLGAGRVAVGNPEEVRLRLIEDFASSVVNVPATSD